jgi:hypothetical protein
MVRPSVLFLLVLAFFFMFNDQQPATIVVPLCIAAYYLSTRSTKGPIVSLPDALPNQEQEEEAVHTPTKTPEKAAAAAQNEVAVKVCCCQLHQYPQQQSSCACGRRSHSSRLCSAHIPPFTHSMTSYNTTADRLPPPHPPPALYVFKRFFRNLAPCVIAPKR